jgi:hypothetical protein
VTFSPFSRSDDLADPSSLPRLQSVEAAIVQLFVEAKRHKPSVLYIPSLAQWANTMTETARSTVRALLDSLSPSDPVMLLAVVDGKLESLPKDVKAWFGYSKENRIMLRKAHEVRSVLVFYVHVFGIPS